MTMSANLHLGAGPHMAVDRDLRTLKFGDFETGEVTIFLCRHPELFTQLAAVMAEHGAKVRPPLKKVDDVGDACFEAAVAASRVAS